eukprot:scaffold26900_cov51-Phaeocystis_antarctica.AAC.4
MSAWTSRRPSLLLASTLLSLLVLVEVGRRGRHPHLHLPPQQQHAATTEEHASGKAGGVGSISLSLAVASRQRRALSTQRDCWASPCVDGTWMATSGETCADLRTDYNGGGENWAAEGRLAGHNCCQFCPPPPPPPP